MPEPKMTIKQRKWVEAYVRTGNATQAAREAGYDGNDVTLANIGSENVRKLQIPISELMDQMGLTDGRLLKVLEEGLAAESVKIASDKGQITDERAYADFGTRAKYLELALRLKGRLNIKAEVAGTSEDNVAPISVTINAQRKND